MSKAHEQSPAVDFARRWIVLKLYVNGVALAGLGLVFTGVFLQAGLRLGPDQLAEFLIGALVVAPADLAVLLSAGLFVFIRLYVTVLPRSASSRFELFSALAIFTTLKFSNVPGVNDAAPTVVCTLGE